MTHHTGSDNMVKFQRRHYILIAEELADKGALTVDDFVRIFKADNSKFSEDTFREKINDIEVKRQILADINRVKELELARKYMEENPLFD